MEKKYENIIELRNSISEEEKDLSLESCEKKYSIR